MWISKKEYESIKRAQREHLEEIRTVRAKYLEEIRTVEAKMMKLCEALSLILPDELKPARVPFALSSHKGYGFQAILDAAEAVKRAEKQAEDKEILKLVKAMKGKA